MKTLLGHAAICLVTATIAIYSYYSDKDPELSPLGNDIVNLMDDSSEWKVMNNGAIVHNNGFRIFPGVFTCDIDRLTPDWSRLNGKVSNLFTSYDKKYINKRVPSVVEKIKARDIEVLRSDIKPVKPLKPLASKDDILLEALKFYYLDAPEWLD